MGSREADSWSYGTVLRDNLDRETVILLSYEVGEPMVKGTLVGPPDRRWNVVYISNHGTTGVAQHDEEYLLLYFQERVA